MKKRRIALMCAIGISAILGAFAFAQMGGDQHRDMVAVTPPDLEWRDGPPSLPRGAQFAVLSGNPSEEGMFVMRLKLPANYRIAPHWHPADENVTVISGTFYMGQGTTFNREAGKRLSVGGYAMMPAGMRHFAFIGDTETVIQLHGQGPWQIHYVNPADDPRGGGTPQ